MEARLAEGITLFNQGRYFESHEILESLYHETDGVNRPFIEGLIQLAAAFRIFRDFGETRGPVRMIYQSLMRFENYQPAFLDVRVEELCASMDAWAKAAEAAGAHPVVSTIPKIHLQQTSLF